MKSSLAPAAAVVITLSLFSACSTSPVKPFATPFEEPERSPAKAKAGAVPEVSTASSMSGADMLEFSKWSAVTTPTNGETEIIGTYAAGCLAGAKMLPLESSNYIVMHPLKRAYFGDASLLKYVTELAARAHEAGLPPLIVEDLSHPRGGPVAKGHGSHQTGLDVDISFTFATRVFTALERETFDSPSYVDDRKNLLPPWTDAQTKLVSLGADNENVNRIFVSPAIKKYFCERYPTAPWLYKLRPWWGHENHMHVRLNCPPGSILCRKQAALSSKQNPCGEDLKWWLSAKADSEWNSIQAFWKTGQSKGFPKLPSRCEQVRSAP